MRVERNGDTYLGECLEYPVMTHGASLDELAENMRKALSLFMREDGGGALGEDSMVVALRVDLPGPGSEPLRG